MKNQLINRFLRSSGSTSIAFAALLLSASSTNARDHHHRGDGKPFTKIYAFGDSLCDTGNFFALTGSPGAPYFEGRFSNGLVWIEYLAEEMGMRPDDVVNYAVGGASTGRENERDIPGLTNFPGLQDEIDYFEEDLGGKSADQRALYIVWAGANDFLIADAKTPEEIEATIKTAIGNTVVAALRLYEAGARRILVPGLPDLGLTPYGQLGGQSAQLSYVTYLYNEALEAALDQLEAAGIRTSRLDSAQLIQDMVAEPAAFGLSNATDPFLAVGGDPSGFLFWDAIHPSTTGHWSIAQEAMNVLRRDFRHAWATPRNRQARNSRR
ncbi:MAG: SGNH/GDSL hydrolase family protein [Verrucomicrobiales bacterium]